MQVEGAKRWRLYHPRDPSEHLALNSSANFNQSEIGKPFLDVVLRSGDLLCLPRGMIHQAMSLAEAHSLHITVSTGWHSSYADLLKMMLPYAVDRASKVCQVLKYIWRLTGNFGTETELTTGSVLLWSCEQPGVRKEVRKVFCSVWPSITIIYRLVYQI